ncbi:probable receptor-like protein kinase At5g20050 [Cajanus cajan]|uniref:LRR receptor-like serine/threonine-protein kinase At2g23950 family n=1 Tax=Cajanus cajan TaxID=3821 RepID=A0A151QRX4_CAJCA|nr:probable receptor-like protein kinase At5g20050 [Cajanus cajan]KYP33015.1 putative LRR receptor-like serine/threonine-protein kinase At2g23950 family [Cajanus cajan]
MEERRVNIIAATSVITLIILIIVARVTLKLSKAFFLFFGAGVAVILAVFVYVFVSISHNRRRRVLESEMKSEGQELRIEYSFLRKVAGVPVKFRYKELEEATDGFQSLIGKGASASVFKGILNDGTSVAVKRINDAEERGEKEFRSEVAAIASVHHVNLVRLYGYCNAPSAPRYLVYEYVSNGSLDCWIFPKRVSQTRRGGCLSWNLRYQVAVDVAKGLAYLHHDCRSRILHLDVKPENILLDENYRALVSDFGLAKLIGKDESYKVMSTIRGTRGYLAPEWLLEQGVSDKTDIYSYGMVLLEIVGGRKNVCLVEDERGKSKRKWQYFPKIVNERVREGKFMEIVDRRLLECGGVDESEVRRMVYVALWCVQERPRIRPSMTQVVDMLEGRVRVELPPDTRMVTVDLLGVNDSGTDSNSIPRLDSVSGQRTESNAECTSTYSFATTVLSGR